jgi:hypothetical protein
MMYLLLLHYTLVNFYLITNPRSKLCINIGSAQFKQSKKWTFITLTTMKQTDVNFGHVRNIPVYEFFQSESQCLPFCRIETGKSEEG